MNRRTYEALITQPENVARVHAGIRAIERVGGSVQIAPPTHDGITLVTLILPDPYRPDQFFPGLPFYPI